MAPYQPPPLPRYLLASRVKELEGRMGEMEAKKADDPRIAVARTALEGARAMLREAGGPTERRLAFSLLDADDRIGRAQAQLAQTKEELQEAKRKVAEELERQTKLEEKAAAEEQLVENAKARRAHLGVPGCIGGGTPRQGLRGPGRRVGGSRGAHPLQWKREIGGGTIVRVAVHPQLSACGLR